MRFPFLSRKESRQSESQPGASYTDVLTNLLVARAEGVTSDPSATAALEAASGLVGRAFGMATVEPKNPRTMALNVPVMVAIGRDLIRRGESVFRLTVRDGEAVAEPASHWDISGSSANPLEWDYRLDLPTPSSTRTVRLPGSGVLHPRYATHSTEPWRGIGPLGFASTTGRMMAGLEGALAGEANGPYGHLIPIPDTKTDISELKTELSALRGGVKLVDTMQAGWGEGQAVKPSRDWSQTRVGIDPSEGIVSLRSDAAQAVLAACGVPVPLVASGEGASAREAWRRFLHSTVQPLADSLAHEARVKLGVPELTITFSRLFASDLAGRARAFGTMVKGGMDLGKAAGLAGLLGDFE